VSAFRLLMALLSTRAPRLIQPMIQQMEACERYLPGTAVRAYKKEVVCDLTCCPSASSGPGEGIKRAASLVSPAGGSDGIVTSQCGQHKLGDRDLAGLMRT